MGKIRPVILCGGNGTRLWPLSREKYPKQFHQILGEASMFQTTLLRFSGEEYERPIALTNEEFRFLAASQAQAIDMELEVLVLEPSARGTAPAAIIAALLTQELDNDSLVLLVPSDHTFADEGGFRQDVSAGVRIAQEDRIVVFGIQPSRPETGYGYIKAGPKLVPDDRNIYSIDEFREKPDIESAKEMLMQGDYRWNSGIFLFPPALLEKEMKTYAPEILVACRAALSNAAVDQDFTRLDATSFESCPTGSLDHTIMEKTRHCAVVQIDRGWSDVGSWKSLWEIGEKDDQGNVSDGDCVLVETTNSLIRSDSGILIATLGLENITVIASDDSVFVGAKDHPHDIKRVVEELRNQHRTEHIHHTYENRPWGSFHLLNEGMRHKVKRISVKPGGKLSLQLHHHRSEHWIVVHGMAEVTRGEETFFLRENESTYIQAGVKHRLVNNGTLDLDLIEVQVGSYLGEDDILRFQDQYRRE